MKPIYLLLVTTLLSPVSLLAQKIFIVDYKSQADLKVYVVEYESQAGWKNKEKQYLLL
jgi:hypothetical protein